jgi:hypothetical protein
VTGFSTIWEAGAAAGLAGGGGGVVLQAVATTPAISSMGMFFSFANLIAYLLSLETDNWKRTRTIRGPDLLICFFFYRQCGFVNTPACDDQYETEHRTSKGLAVFINVCLLTSASNSPTSRAATLSGYAAHISKAGRAPSCRRYDALSLILINIKMRHQPAEVSLLRRKAEGNVRD